MEELQYDLTVYPTPVLRQVAEPFEAFDEELKGIVVGMLALMYKSEGVGLAGPQVGLKKRIFVMNATGEPDDEIAMINPRILEKQGQPTIFEEGCLSFPGIYAEVTRPDNCTVEYWTAEGDRREEDFTGFPSRVIQHEYDHLEGVLLVDRMSRADKLRHKNALAELVEDYRSKKVKAAK
ncbi:MAG: peptide deformylase [Planctomycetota bacterium]|jgi:peptide deformylase